MDYRNSDTRTRETILQAALRRLNDANPPTKAQVIREYNIPRRTLFDRLAGRNSRFQPRPQLRRLKGYQEDGVIKYCLDMERVGIDIRRRHVADVAHRVLKDMAEDPEDPPPPVSRRWVSRFIQRNPELCTVTKQSIEVLRKASHNPNAIVTWFDNYRRLRDELGMQEEDIWNFDETGFRIGVGRKQRVVVSAKHKRRKDYIPSTSGKGYATSIECISAAGGVIPPFVILQGKHILAKWYELELDPDTAITVSESGYTNDELTLQWIKHFEYHTRSKRRGRWRLLLCDGFESHHTIEFLQYCENHDIKVLCFPSHSTHYLQPLDVGVFQPLKYYYSRAVDDAARTGCIDFNKVEFLAALPKIRKLAFTRYNVFSSWRKAGLQPIDVRAALQVVTTQWAKERQVEQATPPPVSRARAVEDVDEVEIRAATPASSPPLRPTRTPSPFVATQAEDTAFEDQIDHIEIDDSPSVSVRLESSPILAPHGFSTPKTARTQSRYSKNLSSRLDKYNLSSPTQALLNKHIKGVETIGISSREAWKTLREMETVAAARRERKSLNNRRLNPSAGGVLTVEKGRQMTAARAAEEAARKTAREQQALEREERRNIEEMDRSQRAVDRELQKEDRDRQIAIQRADLAARETARKTRKAEKARLKAQKAARRAARQAARLIITRQQEEETKRVGKTKKTKKAEKTKKSSTPDSTSSPPALGTNLTAYNIGLLPNRGNRPSKQPTPSRDSRPSRRGPGVTPNTEEGVVTVAKVTSRGRIIQQPRKLLI